MNITAIEIIKDYLEKNNFGGLWNSDGECGCELSELIPCDNMDAECMPGYKNLCSKCDVENCHIKNDSGCDWCIGNQIAVK